MVGGIFIKSNRSVYAPHLTQSMWLRLFTYRGGDNAHLISKNKMIAVAVQWELCGRNVRENIANLQVSAYYGNNDLFARVLFVQHLREQGERLRQKLRYARVLTASFACSLGCWTNSTLAARSLSPEWRLPLCIFARAKTIGVYDANLESVLYVCMGW